MKPTRPFLRLVHHPRPELIGRERRLQPGQRLELGRDSDAFGPGGLSDPRISRVHCRVVRLSHGLIIEDLGSRNGTLVIGHPVRRAELEPGDIISLGHVVIMVCQEPLGETAPPPPPPGCLVTESAAMWPARRRLLDPAHLHGPSAVVGPSGSGRVAMTRCLHKVLGRIGSLVILPLAGIEDDRIHHALHGDGADPAAAALARAEGGTLMLPGIDAASPRAVQEVLHFLREGRQEPVTGDPCPVDVKVVMTSTRKLDIAAMAGDLPAELWELLEPRTISVPALADRPDDILPLARHLAQRHAGRPMRLDHQLAAQLCLHGWPGGIDELDAVMARMVGEQLDAPVLRLPGWAERAFGPDAHDPESTFDPGALYTAEKP